MKRIAVVLAFALTLGITLWAVGTRYLDAQQPALGRGKQHHQRVHALFPMGVIVLAGLDRARGKPAHVVMPAQTARSFAVAGEPAEYRPGGAPRARGPSGKPLTIMPVPGLTVLSARAP